MENYNKKSIWKWILLYVLIAAVAYGLVYYFFLNKNGNDHNVQNQQNPNQNNTTTAQQLSESAVINAINTHEGINLKKDSQGFYEFTFSYGGGHIINSITKGDINGDSFQDAVVYSTVCGASCGSHFSVVINENGSGARALSVILEDIVTSGAAQYGIKNITINNEIITIDAEMPQQNGSSTISAFHYKFVGSNLVKVN